jgi:antirestriction protein ArdC
MEVLRDDNRAFFRAAAKAQQAADYLRSFSGPMEAADAAV